MKSFVFRMIVAVMSLIGMGLIVAGCGGTSRPLVQTRISNLSRLNSGFHYTAWAMHLGASVRLIDFLPDGNNSATFARFAIFDSLVNGDRIFVTIEQDGSAETSPSSTLVLNGAVAGRVNGSTVTVNLTFPPVGDLAGATAFAKVQNGTQVLVELANLPDVSSQNFIYQGFLLRSGVYTPLKTFDSTASLVSDTVSFDPTTAQYILTVRPSAATDGTKPYSAQPFFSKGNLKPAVRQALTNSAFASPGDVDYRFPFGTAIVE